MNEQGCHKYKERTLFDGSKQMAWYCFKEDQDWGWIINVGDTYCPLCGTKLLADGTEQRMVPAVTPEAVAGTRLYDLLDAASSNLPQGSLPHGELDALVTLGLVDGSDPHAAVPLTEQGRTILAAIQQARGLAAAEWLAKEGTDEVCARCGFWHICHDDDNPKMGKIGDGDCAKWLVATALATHAALAAGEPGEPTADELLDAVRLLDEARANGELTVIGIFKDDTAEGRAAKLQALGELSEMIAHNPAHALTDAILGSAQDIRDNRAIIAAQRGGEASGEAQ